MKIEKSTRAEWEDYYLRQIEVTDKQLRYVCEKLPHILRLAMDGKAEDVLCLCRMISRRLKYPRDKDPLIEEIKKHVTGAGGLLREDEV